MTATLLLALFFADADPLLQWMNGVAQAQLSKRAAEIASIRDTATAEKRKEYVRAKVLELIGGLPDYRGPLKPSVTRTLDRGDFVIENVTFESFPSFVITANLYRPKKAGRHPAVLIPMGHWEQGKLAAQLIASNLALKGFVVLAYDPIGQGERQQAYDPRFGKSIMGGATEQHFLPGAQALLLGQSFARYRIWDGIRALDYLVSRPEVDAERIGCTGCSGGGTLATYISALDSRVKVAAPACYMNSFQTLFAGSVGDSEQSLPNFLSSGLDQTDYVELFAPKPWLIASTERDFFTPAGAKQVFEEARVWYKVYGAEDRIQWVVGPGGHGTPLKVREAIYSWMIRWLKNGEGSASEQKVELAPDHMLLATERGQVSGRDVWEIISETKRLDKDQDGLVPFVRELLRTNPAVSTAPSAGLRIDGATIAIPAPAATRLSGNARPNTRAWLIGHNLPAIRASEIAEQARTLQGRGLKPTVRATGVAGIWALLAAVAEPAIHEVVLEGTPVSYDAAIRSAVHRNLHDAVIPGFALRWDLKDLVSAIKPRKVRWINPSDWMGNAIRVPGDYEYRSSDPNVSE
jgi:dienelactone hydrolase